MRARFFCALVALALFLQTPARADVRQHFSERSMVRLQVIAASDSDEDQALKLRVRDAVRAVAVPIAAEAGSPEEAFQLLEDHVAELTRAAHTVDPSARVELSEAQFPMRIYGGTVVPSGKYRALRIVLGPGAGRNWWCVVYPDLCATSEPMASALRAGEPVQFYSSILRWLFGGDKS